MKTRVWRRALTLLLLPAIAAAGCTADSAGTRLTVYAASSLTDVFRDLAAAFEAKQPEVDLALNFAGSQTLRLQIEQGAPADLIASAHPEHMKALTEAGLIQVPQVFAHNDLVIIVPKEGSTGIEGLADLPKSQRLVLGTEQVPVGRYARDVLRRAELSLGSGFTSRVLARLASEEHNARLLRAKVALGEADAAMVYRSDGQNSDEVRSLTIPAPWNIKASYSAAATTGSTQSEQGQAWLDFLLEAESQALLSRHGFGALQ